MASLSTDSRGFRRLLFVNTDGKRKTIRLGNIPLKTCETIKVHVEALVAAKFGNCSTDPRTAQWVNELGDALRTKLAAVGLADRRARATLGTFTEDYIAGRTDTKANTISNLKYARKPLVEYFGESKPLQSITQGDADEYRRCLLERMGINTARRCLGRAKQFFRAAVRKRLLAENPFADMKDTTVQANTARQFYITEEAAQSVIEACPDNHWRLLFALARYGGLRTPSEPLALKWGDVNWEKSRFRVPGVKTGERWVPIFPELRPHIEAAFHAAEPGTEYVITRYRDAAKNLRTHMHRIIRKAGLTPWEKTFQNLRSTRETELIAQGFAVHDVCYWLGNSPKVALKHYLQVREVSFELASKTVSQGRFAPVAAAGI